MEAGMRALLCVVLGVAATLIPARAGATPW